MAKFTLTKAWEEIKKETLDLVSIDITTFSAPDLKLTLKSDDPFNLDDLFAKITGQIKDGSTLTLVAHSHIDFDLDAVMIAKEDAPTGLMEAHNKAVQTAIDGRQSFVKALKDMF